MERRLNLIDMKVKQNKTLRIERSSVWEVLIEEAEGLPGQLDRRFILDRQKKQPGGERRFQLFKTNC